MTKPETNQPTTDIPTSELLHRVDAQIALDAEALQPDPVQPPAAYHYDTETTEMARTFINQIDRLSRLISEDETELDFLAKDRDRQMHEAQLAFEAAQDAILNNHTQAASMVTARRNDRAKARAAAQTTIDALRGANTP